MNDQDQFNHAAVGEGLPIELFRKPTDHPWGMLPNMRHGFEAEQTLVYVFNRCIEAGKWINVACRQTHPGLVDAGLLSEPEETPDAYLYRLTEKAKGLLYGYYGRHTASASAQQPQPNA